MNKINKYLNRLIKKQGGEIKESVSSTYYCLNNKILRVSDHVGRNSSGNISIIVADNCKDKYFIHCHKTGNISVLNYNEVKQLVKSWTLVSSLFTTFEEDLLFTNNDNSILGYDKSKLPPKFVKHVTEVINSRKNKK